MLARRLTLAALLPVVLASCGGADDPETVCKMIKPATVAAELRSAGVERGDSLRVNREFERRQALLA